VWCLAEQLAGREDACNKDCLERLINEADNLIEQKSKLAKVKKNLQAPL